MSGPVRTATSRTKAKPAPDGVLSTPRDRLTDARHAGVADAGQAAAVAAPTWPVPPHPLREALKKMRRSKDIVERNTAEAIDTGQVKVKYMENPSAHPNSAGSWNGEYVVVNRNSSPSRVRVVLVHEVSHALDLETKKAMHHAYNVDLIEAYETEFDAYWITFAHIKNPDARAKKIKAHILSHPKVYPDVTDRYQPDTNFESLVNEYTRPEGNILNSLRYEAVEDAAQKGDAQGVYDAIRSMSRRERAAALDSADLINALRYGLADVEFVFALALLRPRLAVSAFANSRRRPQWRRLGTPPEATEAMSRMPRERGGDSR